MRARTLLILLAVGAAGVLALVLARPSDEVGAVTPARDDGGQEAELPHAVAPTESSAEVDAPSSALPTAATAVDPRVAQSADDVTRAPLRIRLRREETGALLPHYHLELRQGDEVRERVVSDERGIVVSRKSYSAGELTLMLVDHPENDRPKEQIHDHLAPGASALVDVRVPSGYTLLLDFELPEGLSITDLQAFTRQGSRARALDRAQNWRLNGCRLREGDPPWVRFYKTWLGRDDAEWLVVQDDSGVWVAIANLEGEPPFMLEWEAWASVELRFELEGGELPHDFYAFFRQVDGSRTRRNVRVGSDGVKHALLLEPGTYVVDWSPPLYDPVNARIDLPAGRKLVQEIRLREAAIGGTVQGTLTSQTGENRYPKFVLLRATNEGAQREVELGVDWERGQDGAWYGTFASDEVPAGTYRLHIDPLGYPWGLRRWSPEELEVEPPAKDLRFLLLDGPRTFDVGVHVLDRETRTPIDAFWLVDANGRVTEGRSGTPVLWDVLDSEGLFRKVYAEGYRFESFRENDLDSAFGRATGDARYATVRLAKGWRTDVFTHGEAGEEVGRRQYVQVDGKWTSNDGWTVKRENLDARPASYTIERSGYHTLELELPAQVSQEPWTRELEHGRVEVSAFELRIDAYPEPLDEEP